MFVVVSLKVLFFLSAKQMPYEKRQTKALIVCSLRDFRAFSKTIKILSN